MNYVKILLLREFYQQETGFCTLNLCRHVNSITNIRYMQMSAHTNTNGGDCAASGLPAITVHSALHALTRTDYYPLLFHCISTCSQTRSTLSVRMSIYTCLSLSHYNPLPFSFRYPHLDYSALLSHLRPTSLCSYQSNRLVIASALIIRLFNPLNTLSPDWFFLLVSNFSTESSTIF